MKVNIYQNAWRHIREVSDVSQSPRWEPKSSHTKKKASPWHYNTDSILPTPTASGAATEKQTCPSAAYLWPCGQMTAAKRINISLRRKGHRNSSLWVCTAMPLTTADLDQLKLWSARLFNEAVSTAKINVESSLEVGTNRTCYLERICTSCNYIRAVLLQI